MKGRHPRRMLCLCDRSRCFRASKLGLAVGNAAALLADLQAPLRQGPLADRRRVAAARNRTTRRGRRCCRRAQDDDRGRSAVGQLEDTQRHAVGRSRSGAHIGIITQGMTLPGAT